MMFGPVAILGDAEPGKTLIARTGGVVHAQDLVQGSEGFQWLRDGQPIEGETLRTYTVRKDDEGAALSVAYSFRTHEGEQQVISKPDLVPDPFLVWLDWSYRLYFNRPVDPVGVRVYGDAYRNGVPPDQIVAYIAADKARGAK